MLYNCSHIYILQSQDLCESLTMELMSTKKRLVETEEEKQRLEMESQQVCLTGLLQLLSYYHIFGAQNVLI